VIDLLTHLGLDLVLETFGVGNEQIGLVDFHFPKELSVVFENLVKTGFITGNVVPLQLWAAAESGCKREVGSSPDFPIRIG
jgi:hypothetical protein